MTFGLAFQTFGGLGALFSGGDSISLSNSSIPQGSANGTTLGTASIVGSYTGTPVWSLTDPSGTFQINSSTGVITVLSNTDLASPGSLPISISVSGVTPTVPTVPVNVTVTPTGGVFALEANLSSANNEPWVFW
jgi:hypothetical protein